MSSCYFSRVPTRKDLNDLIELRNEMDVKFTKLDESFTNLFMHGASHQPPTQGEDK